MAIKRIRSAVVIGAELLEGSVDAGGDGHDGVQAPPCWPGHFGGEFRSPRVRISGCKSILAMTPMAFRSRERPAGRLAEFLQERLVVERGTCPTR